MSTLAVLTIPEREALARAEEKIQAGVGTFIEVGRALTEIREARLYREQFEAFETYCHQKWGFNRRYANYTIQAFEVVNSLPESLGTTVPTEYAARSLAKVPKEKRAEVLTKIIDGGERVDSATIEREAKAFVTESAPVKSMTPQRFERELELATIHLVDLFDGGAEITEATEENLRFAFESAEERYLDKHPEKIPTVSAALRAMLGRIEKLQPIAA